MKTKSGCESHSPKRHELFLAGISFGSAPRCPRASSLAVLILCILTLGVGKVNAQERSVLDGVYTEAQADRGAEMFGRFCSGCHDTDRFVGEQMKPWANQSAYRFFRVVRLTMPEEDPGSLTRQQYADVLSYIFKLNGFEIGSEELKGTDEAMRAVLLEGF